MPIDPAELTASIGSLYQLDLDRGLAPTLQQVVDAAKVLVGADGAGLMLADTEGRLHWASASDQLAQQAEDHQERGAQGPAWRRSSNAPPCQALTPTSCGRGMSGGLLAFLCGREGDRQRDHPTPLLHHGRSRLTAPRPTNTTAQGFLGPGGG